MTIGIDCLGADPDYVGGLNTYIMGLLGGFSAAGHGHRFQLYVTGGNRKQFRRYEALPNFEGVEVGGGPFWLRPAISRAALLSSRTEFYRRASRPLLRAVRGDLDP